MKPKTGMYAVLPGGNRYKEPEPEEEPKPPEGFVDSTVYRYRLDKDGKKMLIGTMSPFPEGWDKFNNNIKSKRGGNEEMKGRGIIETGEQEPATEIIAENKEQVKETDVPEDEVAYNFTKEDKSTQYKPMEAKDAEPPANAFEKKVDEQIQNLFKTGIPEEVNLLELYIDNITTAAKIRVMKVIKDPVAVEIMREMFEGGVI